MAERNTPYRDAEIVAFPVAADTKVEAGTIGILHDGYLEPGAAATDFTYLGRIEETVDNSGGSAGDLSAMVRLGKAVKWANSGTDPIAQADVGGTCYVEDDGTVAKTNGSNTLSAAGTILGVESDGVWVVKTL